MACTVRWALVALAIVVAGCGPPPAGVLPAPQSSAPSPQPSRTPEPRSASPSAALVAPGPAGRPVPVSREGVHWSASGPTPEEAARRFVLGERPCECARVTVALSASEGDRATVQVRLDGLRDDAIRAAEYQVVVRRGGGRWTVESATERHECRRATTAEGYCL
jgi:hypothetical protein